MSLSLNKPAVIGLSVAGVLLLAAAIGIPVWLLSRKADAGTVAVNGVLSPAEQERQNTLALVKLYIEIGEYDRARNLLDSLLIKNAQDAEALSMMDDVIALKAGASLADFPQYQQLDTAGLEQAIDKLNSELAKSSAAMEEALKKQNAETAASVKRLEEQAAMERASREQAAAREEAENLRREQEAAEQA